MHLEGSGELFSHLSARDLLNFRCLPARNLLDFRRLRRGLRCAFLSLCGLFLSSLLCPRRSCELPGCCSLFLLFSLLEPELLLGIGHFLTLRTFSLLFPCLLFPDPGSCGCTLGFQPLSFGRALCSCAHVDFVREVQNLLPMVFQPHPPNRSSRV